MLDRIKGVVKCPGGAGRPRRPGTVEAGRLRIVAKVPLAEQRGPVAGRLPAGRQGGAGKVHPVIRYVAIHYWVAAGHQGVAGGHAARIISVGALKSSGFRRQPVNIRRLVDLRAVVSQVVHTQVVGYDEQHVGAVLRANTGGQEQQKKRDEAEHVTSD